MPANEAVTRIESAAQFQGIDTAYDVLKEQIDLIQSTAPAGEQNLQLARLANELKRDGLLPDLAIQFAYEEATNIEEDGSFDRDALRAYKRGADPVTVALTNEILRNYDSMRSQNFDWFTEELTEKDLTKALEGVETKEYAYGHGLEAEAEGESGGAAESGEGQGESAPGASAGTLEELLSNLTRIWQGGQQRPEIPSVEVKPGEGFDRVARRVLQQQQQGAVSEADVLEYSRRIAEMNKRDRDSYVLQPGEQLRIPPVQQ